MMMTEHTHTVGVNTLTTNPGSPKLFKLYEDQNDNHITT
jgi:hypothetical protein